MDAISIGAILQFLSGNLFKSLQNISHFPTFFLRQPINEWGNCFALLFTLYSMTRLLKHSETQPRVGQKRPWDQVLTRQSQI